MHSIPTGQPETKPLAITIADAGKVSGLGRTSLYEHIKAGRLPVVKAGRRTLIRVEALDAFLRSLEVRRAAA